MTGYTFRRNTPQQTPGDIAASGSVVKVVVSSVRFHRWLRLTPFPAGSVCVASQPETYGAGRSP